MRVLLVCLALTSSAALPLWAQGTGATAKSFAAWRFSHGTAVVRRVVNEAYSDELVDRFAAATSKAIGKIANREHVARLVSEFDPLWDSTGNLASGAAARYAQRVATTPVSAVRRWASLTGEDPHFVAFTVASLGGLWYAERFSAPAFARLVARVQRDG